MAYVIEEISDDDYRKYNLDEVEKNGDPSYHYYWAIDRERGIWLREYYKIFSHGKELSTVWGFYYKGYLIFIEIEGIAFGQHVEKKIWYLHKRFIRMFCPFTKLLQPELPQLPEELEDKKEEILKEFKKALEESCGDPFFGRDKKDRGETCKIDIEYNGEMI